MVAHLLGKKVGMTQVFGKDGVMLPVTVLEAGPCRVIQIKTVEKDGYAAAQIGYEPVTLKKNGTRKGRFTKPLLGHFKKVGLESAPLRYLREVPIDVSAPPKVGDSLGVALFEGASHVDVVGTTKGRGFTGTVKRHGFAKGPRSHGSMNVRRPGAIGQHQDPGRVFPGKKMAGQHGAARRTVRHLKVVSLDLDRNLLFLHGAVPGPNGGMVLIRETNWVQ